MRVLHVTSGNLFGGIETMLLNMARCRQLWPNLEPTFAVCFEGRLTRELRQLGAEVHVLGPVRVARPLSVLRVRKRLRHLLESGSFDWVVCHAAWPMALFGSVRRSEKTKLGFWLHDCVTGRHWLERCARLVRPDLAICNSRFTATTLTNLYKGVPATISYPLASPPQGFPAEDRDEVRKSLATHRDTVVIIQASRMERWKGHEALLLALAQLRDVPGWECWIAGGGQRPEELKYLEALRQRTKEAGLQGRVQFLGQRTDVPRLLAAADIHCQPNSGPEPYGLAFVEALGAGLPVVTTAQGGALEVLDGSCSILVEPGSTKALTEALTTLIGDASRRACLGRGARERATYFLDPARHLQQLHTALMEF